MPPTSHPRQEQLLAPAASHAVDDVEHAGAFVEIERTVGGQESGTAVQAEPDGFARSLGVVLERTSDTYDSLVRAAPTPAWRSSRVPAVS